MSAFIGFKPGCKGYLLLDLLTQQIHVTRHVNFFETLFPFQSFPISSPTVSLPNYNNDHLIDHSVSPPFLLILILLLLHLLLFLDILLETDILHPIFMIMFVIMLPHLHILLIKFLHTLLLLLNIDHMF